MKRTVTALFVLSLLAMACGTSTTSNPSDRCVLASELQMQYLDNGIKQIQQSNGVLQGYAVRSGDYERVWFVAAEITGPGIEPKTVIGLWAMSGELDFPTTVFSVDGFANEFSYWSDGRKAAPKLSMFDDGAQEALSCVQ